MNCSDLPQDILDGAFRIFIQETKQAVSDTQFILHEGELKDHPLLKDAKIKFHKIKGGAGFFGLIELEKSASKVELYVKMLMEHQNQEQTCIRDAYNELVEKADLLGTSI